MAIDDTLPPPPPSERNMRRAGYVTGVVNAGLGRILDALENPMSGQSLARGELATLLEDAWDDGAARVADLELAVGFMGEKISALESVIESLQTTVQGLQGEIARLGRELHEERSKG